MDGPNFFQLSSAQALKKDQDNNIFSLLNGKTAAPIISLLHSSANFVSCESKAFFPEYSCYLWHYERTEIHNAMSQTVALWILVLS